MTATNADMTKLMTPTAGLSFGHYFTPVVGARLHVNAWQAKSGFKDLDKYYKWKYVTPSADLLINLTNLVSGTPQHPLNVILLGGVGLNYAWDNDELKDMGVMVSRTPLAWKDNRLSHNLRAGLRLETDVTKPLGLSLEVAANSTDDRFNSKTNDQDDWQFTAMLGISYRFGKSYKRSEPEPIVKPVQKKEVEEVKPEVVPETPVTTVEPVVPQPIVEEKKTEVKTDAKVVIKKESLNEEIFYVICKSDPNVSGQDQMQRVADFMKKYKDAKVSIVGYADKGTGNPKINKMYAERRARECRDTLVKKYGCDKSRIIIDSKGDTVQPFTENDKNRCVIIGSETQVTTNE
jgi:outer membrane protein OmpA-like peptidoglycan-associated protein